MPSFDTLDTFDTVVAFETSCDRKRRRERLHERAADALMSLLTSEMRDLYRAQGHFVITGSLGGRYLIKRGYSGNVTRLNDRDEAVESYCAHPPMHTDLGESAPLEVAMIAQVLAITDDERGFLEVANMM